MGRKKPDDDGQARDYALLVIQVERVRFVFDETIDEQEFIKRRIATGDFLESLLDSAIEPRQGPPDGDWYYWSERKQSWGAMSDARQDDYDAWMKENAHYFEKKAEE